MQNTTIIIGRNGDQAFKIENSGVSSKHAKIIINTDSSGKEHWYLEDVNSSNGTFVRNNDGSFRQIRRCEICPYTTVRLGPATVDGIQFMALMAKELNYRDAFNNLEKQLQQLNDERETLLKRKRWLRGAISFIPIIAFLLSYLIPNQDIAFKVIRLSCLVPALNFLIVDNKAEKKWIQHRNEIIRCPNPLCDKPLTDEQIVKHQCYFCKAH